MAGLAELARAATNDGETLVAFFVAIMEGRAPVGWPEGRRVEPGHMIEAARWLADRGYGKAPITVDVSGTVTHRGELDEYTTDELRAMRNEMARRTIEAEYREVGEC